MFLVAEKILVINVSVWKKIIQENKKEQKSVNLRVEKTMSYHQMRRVLSEAAVEKELPWHFEDGVSYHVLSWGDVDALTYLRLIVKQQHIKYSMLSTWAMATVDAEEIGLWLNKGYIDRIDFYIGEINGTEKAQVLSILYNIGKKHNCKVVMLRNHSKIIVAFGDLFDVVVESSANINTNPRIEQAVITRNSELAYFYKNIFDTFSAYNLDYKQPANFDIGGESDGARQESSSDESKALDERGN